MSIYKKETSKGLSLFTSRDYLAGDIIILVEGKELDFPTDYTFQISSSLYIEPRGVSLVEFLCHGCESNVFFNVEKRSIVALKDIKKDEELLIDYASLAQNIGYSEMDIFGKERVIFNTDCLCGFNTCRGKILGFLDLTEGQKKELLLKQDLPGFVRG